MVIPNNPQPNSFQDIIYSDSKISTIHPSPSLIVQDYF